MRRLSQKVIKNLLDLRHERYLQKSHTITNIGIAFWLTFLGVIAAYVIEGGGRLTSILIESVLIGTSIIFSLTYVFYKTTKEMRFDTLKKIKMLDL